MDSMKLCCVLVLLVVGLARLPALVWGGNGVQRCDFSAIYNFGDSNSDTGGISSAALKVVPTPNGENFFGRPFGRFCDGRLIIDFLCGSGAEVTIPDCAYTDSLGTNFWHGANFATGGSSILPGGYSPFQLGIQISQFKQFKSRTTALYGQLSPNNGPPLCVKHWNEVNQEFDRQLKDKVLQLRAQLPDATFTYVDVHSAKYALISNAKNEGFVDPKRILNDSLSSQ